MFEAVCLGGAGLGFVASGTWYARRQRRRRADTRAGWGAAAFGVAQLFHAAGVLAGHRQPLGVVLATSCALSALCGLALEVAAGETIRNGRARRPQGKRRKLPPLQP